MQLSVKVIEQYVDPVTKVALVADRRGNLCEPGSTENILYENHDGIYDFTSKDNRNVEKEYYDDHYRRASLKPLSIEACRRIWGTWPGFEEVLMSMGNIAAKKILLIGNGTSLKELYLLVLGARCVYTDLSVEAVKYVKAVFDQSELKRSGFDKIEFDVIDVCYLPFLDESFDIIYGFGLVHHVDNLDKLFSEVSRCLKPGGICRFVDSAYSPLWQCLKNVALKPLQIHTHRKHGISPADKIATERGGYKREKIQKIKEAYGFKEILYLRVAFFDYLLWRGTSKLGGRFLRKFKPVMRALDRSLDKVTGLVRKHGIVLVWGFTK